LPATPEKKGFDLGATSPMGAIVTDGVPDPQDPLVAVPANRRQANRE
jgi:hypothetical protein